jgi:hypothetical protein
VSDFDLPRSLLAAGAIEVDYLETGGHFVERTVTQFPGRPLLLHNSVFNLSLAHPTALDEQQVIPRGSAFIWGSAPPKSSSIPGCARCRRPSRARSCS